MQVILLERVENLGQMGQVVSVKPGFARNFLLPQKKALRATKDNIAYFDTQKAQLEAVNLKKKQEAEVVASKMSGLKVVVIRQASEGGHLYGSVSSKDVADAVVAQGVTIEKKQVIINQAIKSIGLFNVKVVLHPELSVNVVVNVARSDDEAKIQFKTGMAVVAKGEEQPIVETPVVAAAPAEVVAESVEETEKTEKKVAKKKSKKSE